MFILCELYIHTKGAFVYAVLRAEHPKQDFRLLLLLLNMAPDSTQRYRNRIDQDVNRVG